MQATGLTYTTEPFDAPKTIFGPITASLYAASTTSNASFFATVEVVAPDGTSYPLTSGQLFGALRKLDTGLSWTHGGKLVLPYHAAGRADEAPMVPGRAERLDVEIF